MNTSLKFNKGARAAALVLFFCLISAASAFGAYPAVTSVTMSPPNPNFGDAVTITVQFCAKDGGGSNYIAIAISNNANREATGTGGQVFVVDSNGLDSDIVNEANNFAYTLPAVTSGTACTNCGPASSYMGTASFTVNVPNSNMFPGCNVSNLYVHVVMKDSNMGTSEWTSLPACASNDSFPVSWAIPLLSPSFDLHKRVEGVIQAQNDLVLFSIDYDYANGPLTISDPLPGGGNLSLVSAGPTEFITTNPGTGASSGTLVWTLPDRTGQLGSATGTVWLLMQWNNPTVPSNTVITNTATGTMNSNVQQASTNITTDQPAMNVIKSASSPQVNLGNNITYYLSYDINGDKLQDYRPFDDNATGAYSPTGPSTDVPAGWEAIPDGNGSGQYGTWTISDACNTGDHIITGSVSSSAKYPALLLNDPGGNTDNVQMCTGIVESDIMINPGSYPGSDALVILRSNGLSGANGYAYSLLLSIDTAPANAYLSIQKCGGGTCSWNYDTSPAIQIVGNKWYRTKTWLTQSGNNYVFQSKVWPVGDPEPGSYQLTWTDTNAVTNANWNCSGTGTYNDWRPGIGEQGNDSDGTTQDNYNNFIVYIPRVASNAYLFDTVPTGLIYGGSNPAGTVNGSLVSWSLGNISDQSGSYTWWGAANTCGNITNTAGLDGDLPILPVFSNTVFTEVICPTPGIGLTKTASPTTVTLGGTVTFTLNFSNCSSLLTATGIYVWDTIPACVSVVNSGGGATVGSMLVWGPFTLPPSASGMPIVWTGTVNCYPLNPFTQRDYFADAKYFLKTLISGKGQGYTDDPKQQYHDWGDEQ